MEPSPGDKSAEKSALSNTTQILDFSSEDGQRLEIFSKDVLVKSNGGTHTQGSSLIKLRNIVDYSWDHKLYSGQLVAVHVSGDYLAYVIKAPASAAGTGMVRVTQCSSEKRALLKGMQGPVQDISFAHITQKVLLGCIDSTSSFYIYHLTSQSDAIIWTLLFSVLDSSESLVQRIVWCSYVPEEGEPDIDEEEDPSGLFVTTTGNKAYIWNLGQITNKHGPGPHQLRSISQPCHTVEHHSQDILEVTFSPDGSALATASRDGLVKFFQPSLLQVYDHNEMTKCVHQWSPHGDKPVSTLFFLDSRETSSSEQFWKYVVTGYENIVKVWSCKDWSCLQTITFSGGPQLKIGLSRSAEQLLVSDIGRRILYILSLTPNSDNATCRCTSIAHFYLPFPFLSFADVHIGKKIYKCPSTCADPYHTSTLGDDENDSPNDEDHMLELEDMESEGCGGVKRAGCSVCSILHMYVVQPKSLQHASITLPDYSISPPVIHSPPLQPIEDDIPPLAAITVENLESSIGVDKSDILSTSATNASYSPQHSIDNNMAQSIMLKNMLLRTIENSNSLLQAPRQPPHTVNLMTPDAFSSPPKRDVGEEVKDVSIDSSVTLHTIPPLTPNNVVVKPTTSGGSSPSREVQEILSVKGDLYEEGEGVEETTPLTQHYNHNNEENIPSLSDGVWPSINMEKINEANQRKANSDVSLNNSFTKSANLIDIGVSSMNGEHIMETESHNQILNVLHKLTLTLAEQQKEIALLRSEVCSMRDSNENRVEHLRTEMCTMRQEITRHGTGVKQLIDGALATRAESERLQRDSLLSGVSQIVGAQMGEKFSHSVAHEARVTILPGLHGILEPIIQAFKTDLAHSLSTTDRLLAENIQKLVNSKSVMEGLCVSVGQVVGDASRQAFREAVQGSLVPPMERALGQMLEQINNIFTTGVKEYLTSLDTYTKKASDQSGKIHETCSVLSKTSSQLQQALEQQNKLYVATSQTEHSLKTHLTKEIHTTLTKSIQGALDNQVSRIKDIVHDQINTGMSAHVAQLGDSVMQAVRSTAQTPAPSLIDTQQHIDQLLQKGELNGAFQAALSASDLRMVVYCCRCVKPQLLSKKPCPLQQNVLLSLIQQLGADMTSDTEIKYKFLEEAVVNLDESNPVNREHMPVVLSQLKKHLSVPGVELPQNMRVLMMAIDFLLKEHS